MSHKSKYTLKKEVSSFEWLRDRDRAELADIVHKNDRDELIQFYQFD